MDDYPEKVEKKTNAYKGTISALFDAYKSSSIHLYSVSASSSHADLISANLKRFHREQMHLLIDNYYDTEDSDALTVPSPVFPLGVAFSSQAAVPSQVGPTAVSQGSHEQHQLVSNTSGRPQSISSNTLPTVPVSAHSNTDVNLESSGHMMRHLQFASGSTSHTDKGESGNSTAMVASPSIGQGQLSAGQGSDMTANQKGEEALNSLVSENDANVVNVQAPGQQRATVSTVVTPNGHAQAEIAPLATAGNSNSNPNIDNVSVKKEIESSSPISASNYNYEEDLDGESVKEEESDYVFRRCIDISSDEEENLEEQVTNADDQIQDANSGPATQAGGAPLTTTVTNAGEGCDTSSDDDNDSVSVKSEDTSECECESDCDSHSGGIEIKEETDEAQTENMTTTASNNGNVSLKMEIESECESSDSESSSDEEELANGQIKEENDNANDPLLGISEEQVNRQLTQAANNEPVQALPTGDFVSLPSTSTGHRRSTRAKKHVNYAAPTIDDSFARKRVNFIRKNKSLPAESESSESSDDEEFVGQQSTKRKGSQSGAAAKKMKQSHVVQHPAVAAAAGASVREEPLKVITKSLNCPQAGCNTVCKDKTSLNGHLLGKHAIEKYRCVVADCTASFSNKNQLIDHRLEHGNGPDWPCAKCSSSFNDYSHLYRHHYCHHEEGLFECSIDDCDFNWITRVKVYKHQKCHRTPKHICSVDNCGLSFVWKSGLNQHLRKHTLERPFVCELCGKSFSQQHPLTVHLRWHSGTMKARCTWPECAYQATTSSTVVKHIRGMHFKLPQCKTKQVRLGIVDDRDARKYLEKI